MCFLLTIYKTRNYGMFNYGLKQGNFADPQCLEWSAPCIEVHHSTKHSHYLHKPKYHPLVVHVSALSIRTISWQPLNIPTVLQTASSTPCCKTIVSWLKVSTSRSLTFTNDCSILRWKLESESMVPQCRLSTKLVMSHVVLIILQDTASTSR